MKNRLWSLALSLSFFTSASNAGVVDIRITSYGSTDPQFYGQVDTAIQQLEDDVNANLPNTDASNYLKAVANSTTMASLGSGVDYANPFKFFIVGAGTGLGFDLGGSSLSSVTGGNYSSIAGLSAQYTMMAGTRLGNFVQTPWAEKTSVFFNFSNIGISKDNAEFKSSTIGFHGKYNVRPGESKAAGSVTWGGVDVSAGYRQSKVRLAISQAYTETNTSTVDVGGTPTQLTSTYNGTVNLGADILTHSFPVDVTTAARLGYIFQFFGGLGVDFNFGQASSISSISGPVSFSSNPTTDINGVTAEANLDLGQSVGPQSMNFRGLAGMGLELGVLSLTFQYNKSFATTADALLVQLRGFY